MSSSFETLQAALVGQGRLPSALLSTRRPLPQTRALQVLSHLHPKYGGVSAVVPQLSNAVAASQNSAVQLAAFCAPGEEFRPTESPDIPVHFMPLSRRTWRAERQSRDEFGECVTASSVVHIHGLWQSSTAIAASLSRQHKKPYIISAHGMLERWALDNKRWKKRLYLALLERNNLQKAACLHALTAAEVRDYRRLGLTNPIAVIPNGVSVPQEATEKLFLQAFPALAGKRLILFLGRIHYKKGLDILTRAWQRTAAAWPDAHLVLAGPDFEGTRSRIEEVIRGADLTQRVTFTGMLNGEMKWSALQACECFILPSYSEGLSVSTLEALGSARPVVITEECNLPQVEKAHCGYVIKAHAEAVKQALGAMLRQSAESRAAMGQRGARLIHDHYRWSVVGQQMASLYRWVAGGEKPTTFEIDEWKGSQ